MLDKDLKKILLLLLFYSFAAPQMVSAGIFSDSEATIVVRNKPSSPYTKIYIVFDGSISEMVAAEDEAEKIFSKSKVIVFRASADISNAQELGKLEKLEEIRKKVASSDGASAILFIKPVSIVGYIYSFSVTLADFGNAKTIAVGDIRSDTDNKTFSGTPAVQSRVAARDALKMFVTDRKIWDFFIR